jgi:hypothetical protein
LNPGVAFGVFSAQLAIIPINDAVIEGAETADVAITGSGTGAYIVGAANVAEIIIADDDLTASVQVERAVCYEPFQRSGPQPTTDEQGAAIFKVALNAPFSATSQGQLTVDFGGSATIDADYKLFEVIGLDANTASRRALNGSSQVVGGWGSTTNIFDANGSIVAFSGNQITVSPGLTHTNGSGSFLQGDVIELEGTSGTFYVQTAAAAGANFDITIVPVGTTILPTQIAKLTAIDSGIALTGGNRFQSPDLQGYSKIEYEIAPAFDALVEGAETVTCALEASPDFTLKDPTVSTVIIADTTPIVSIALTSNAVEGTVNGIATVNSSAAFPFNVTIPYIVTGSANYAANQPNAGQPIDYTLTGLDPTSGIGLVTLPAGQTSVQIVLTPLADALTETVETATISLVSSLDYALAGSSNSSLNPSATINIADSGTTIVVVPPVTTTGTAATGGGTTGGTGPVRPLPTNSGSNSCGLGSGLGIIGLALGTLVRLRQRRR